MVLSLAGASWLKRKESRRAGPGQWVLKLAKRRRMALAVLGCAAFLGCLAVAGVMHEPVPRVPDEFSYLLMADTFAHGHLANPTPPLPEFFDTFHVLIHPVYASKYFPAQGFFLAAGEKLTHHPAVGLWLSSALACAATCWMLQAWIGPVWGLVGGLLMVIQWGIFSYWSQTYWGGMVAALGGALCFGALRRLWNRLSWSGALWFALGAVILVNSRPLEGICSVGIAVVAVLCRAWKARRRLTVEFWLKVVIPAAAVLLLGAAITTNYNHAITGKYFTSPYLEHERQYQQVPAFVFLPLLPQIGYTNAVMADFYGNIEHYRYNYRRYMWPCSTASTVSDWWCFYCGFLFSLPLVVPILLRRGWILYVQLAVLAGMIGLGVVFDPMNIKLCSLMDPLIIAQIVLFWLVYAGFWRRLSISITLLLLVVGLVSKWGFPHYSAPAACLCLYLQVDGLRRMWRWRSATVAENRKQSFRDRRRSVNGRGAALLQGERLRFTLRNLVYVFPILCSLSLVGRVVLRKYSIGSQELLPDWATLITDKGDWSLQRVVLKKLLEQQPGPQLVFVQYKVSHYFASEWVYNDPDLQHSKVVWAHDLGEQYNRRLLKQMPERTAWILQADLPAPQLSLYPVGEQNSPAVNNPVPGAPPSQVF